MTDVRQQIAAALLRRMPARYREPYRWPFGQALHYLTSEDQKAALFNIVDPSLPILWHVIFWAALCVIVAVACVGLWLYTAPSTLDVIAILALTAQVILAFPILVWRQTLVVRRRQAGRTKFAKLAADHNLLVPAMNECPTHE